MLKLLIDKLPRITKNRKKLERELGVKITNRGREVYIDGEAEKEFCAEKVILALNFGFPYEIALTLKNPEVIFEEINIKDHTKRTDKARIKGRIIGKAGKTLSTLSTLTGCNFEIKDNFVGVVGDAELIENATNAIISLIKGSKTGNVYARLEKHQKKPVIDLGLKR